MRALRLFSMIGFVALRCSEAVLLAGFLGISMLRQAMDDIFLLFDSRKVE